MKTVKKMVQTVVMEERGYHFGVDLSDFIERLEALRKDPTARYEIDIGCGQEYDTTYGTVTVTEIREETKEEQRERKKAEKQEKADKLAEKELLFAKLKKELKK